MAAIFSFSNICMYKCILIEINMFTYIYMCIYIYIHVYIYIYIILPNSSLEEEKNLQLSVLYFILQNKCIFKIWKGHHCK